MREDETTEELLAEVLERLDRGETAALDDVCAKHPEHATTIRSRFERLRRLGLFESRRPGEAPERLGGFQILECLGSGGMGVVYRARDEELGREVALKIVRPDQLHSEAIRQRFRREIEIVARMQHPGIAPIYSVGSEDGVPYFAMEYVRGASLQQVVDRLAGTSPEALIGADFARVVAECSGLDPAEASGEAYLFAASWEDTCLRVGVELCEALAHAHERGVRHRDIKPSNVMITPEGRVFLLDFGLSRFEGSARLTLAQAPVGSLLYMPPERVEDQGADDSGSGDIYSLGATLYELLALRPPFDATSAPSLLLQISKGERRPLRQHNPAVTWETETVCESAMELDHRRRYGGAADLGRDLRNVLERRPIEARRAGLLLRARRLVQRRPTASVALCLGALLVVGGPLVYARQEHRSALEIAGVNEDLEEALERVEAQRQRALENFDTAFEAVQVLLERVGREELRDVPRVQEVRADLLVLARGFYTRLQEREPDDVRIQRALARAGVGLGSVLDLLGRRREAREMLEGEIARLEALVASAEDPNDLRLDLVRALTIAGRTMHLASDVTAAEEAYAGAERVIEQVLASGTEPQKAAAREFHEAFPTQTAMLKLKQDDPVLALETYAEGIEDARRRLDADPGDRDAQSLLASLLNDHGRLVYRRLRDLTSAEAILLEAHDLRVELAGARPDDREERIGLFNTCLNLAAVQRDLAKLDEAAEIMEAGFEVAWELVERFPSVPEYRSALGDAYITNGVVVHSQGEPELGLEQWGLAVELFEELCEQSPLEAGYHSSLGLALSNAGFTQNELGRHDVAEELLARSVRAHEASRLLLPDHPEYRGHLARAMHNQLVCYLAQEEPEPLLPIAQRAAELQPDGVPSLFDLACFLAEGSRLVLRDESLEPEVAERRAGELLAAGRHYLQRALELDPELTGRDRNDPRLAPLEPVDGAGSSD